MLNCAWQLRPPARCARPELYSGLPCFVGRRAVCSRTVGKPNSGTRPGERVMDICYCGRFILVFALLIWSPLAGGFWFRCISEFSCWIIFGKGVRRSRGMNHIMWRYGLKSNRCRGDQWRCRGDVLRCAATRRVTSRTGAVSGSANREKTGCFVVKTGNSWLVFQCTVNWSRARLS